MGYITLFLIKVLDNVISTAKSIATYQEKKILSSILVVISQLIFYLVISQVISDSTILSIVIVSVASGIGNLLAFIANEKIKKDTKWVFIITSSNIEDIKGFGNHLTNCNIKHIINDGYTRSGDKTMNVLAFSKTKNESRLIEDYLNYNMQNKYLKEII